MHSGPASGNPSGIAAALLALFGFLRLRRLRGALAGISPARIAWAAVCGSLLVLGCGDDEVVLGVEGDSSSGRGGSSAGSAGTGGSGATGGTGNADASAGTGGVSGSEGGDAAGGSSNESGPDVGGSAGAAGSDASTDARPDTSDRCLSGNAAYRLTVCQRLTPTQQVTAINQLIPEYVGKVFSDCRVAKLIDQYPSSFEFLNELEDWSSEFWGCRTTGVTNFGPAGRASVLSAADVRVIIEHYLGLAALRLSLSTTEMAEMRLALECLGARAMTNPSATQHEMSKCVSDSGVDSAADGGIDSAADTGSDADADEGGGDSATE